MDCTTYLHRRNTAITETEIAEYASTFETNNPKRDRAPTRRDASPASRIFVDIPGIEVSVRSGSSKYDYGGTIHNVTYMAYHEKYNDDDNDYDVAVIKVTPPFRYSDVTKPAKLPNLSRTIDASVGLVCGWGYFIDDDPVLSENLQYVFVPRVSKGTCRRYYKYRYSVTDHQLCYGFENGGKDSCKGDSGGPLIKNSTVIGITSWGAECGEPDSPGVYTDVLSVLDWIKNKTKLN
ncbi:trypsin-7 isoform X2 [Lasioglossum baleicum]|uniref:trypsin-7 isoform X2 n=1 Tax=Lasioglossum baleicum TaxID=434251 RepID=UPI003FCDF6D6